MQASRRHFLAGAAGAAALPTRRRYVPALRARGTAKSAAGVSVTQYTMTTAEAGSDVGAPVNALFADGVLEIDFEPGVYPLTTMIEYPPYSSLRASVHDSLRGGVVITQQPGANLDAMCASAGWLEGKNKTTAADPALIEGITFQGYSKQTSGQGNGIVSQNWRQRIRDCVVCDVAGDGIRLDAFSQDGTVKITNSAPECRITGCIVRYPGAHGIRTTSPGGSGVFTDGFLEDCIVQHAVQNGIWVSQANGWVISGNHLYSAATTNGIRATGGYATRIIKNYVETWGTTTGVGTFSGIMCDGLNDLGNNTIVALNTLRFVAPAGNPGSVIVGIRAIAKGPTGCVLVVGNTLRAAASAAAAFSWECVGSGDELFVTSGVNFPQGEWAAQVRQVPHGGKITIGSGI